MKFIVTLDRDEDGAWIAECPSIPGCVSQATTREEALANIEEAIAACLEMRAEQSLPSTHKIVILGLACPRRMPTGPENPWCSRRKRKMFAEASQQNSNF